MKVESQNQVLNLDPRLAQGGGNAAEQSKETSKAGAAATVSVSQSAASLHGIKDQLDKVSEIRADKVAQIKAEVEAGTYNRSAEEIAEKMITSSLQDALYQQ